MLDRLYLLIFLGYFVLYFLDFVKLHQVTRYGCWGVDKVKIFHKHGYEMKLETMLTCADSCFK